MTVDLMIVAVCGLVLDIIPVPVNEMFDCVGARKQAPLFSSSYTLRAAPGLDAHTNGALHSLHPSGANLTLACTCTGPLFG